MVHLPSSEHSEHIDKTATVIESRKRAWVSLCRSIMPANHSSFSITICLLHINRSNLHVHFSNGAIWCLPNLALEDTSSILKTSCCCQEEKCWKFSKWSDSCVNRVTSSIGWKSLVVQKIIYVLVIFGINSRERGQRFRYLCLMLKIFIISTINKFE